MSIITEMHEQAMDLTDLALEARRHGDGKQALELFTRALQEERAAAESAPLDAEPTRSVLYRSAATLALDAGMFREAERLIATALAGNPPHEIAEELRDLLERVYFQRHLDLRGIVLESHEFQFTIAGADVTSGLARSEEFTRRIESTRKLIRQTSERQGGRKFKDSSVPSREGTETYISLPRAASYAVTIRVGRPKSQLAFNLGEEDREVVPELLTCLELTNENRTSELRDRISDAAYYRNFIGLVRQIAPDGNNIRLVGFTATDPRGDERRIAFARTPQELPLPEPAPTTARQTTLVDVTGQLLFADATNSEESIIRLLTRNGKRSIKVPEGMGEIVRSLWEEEVTVSGYKQGKTILLADIRRASVSTQLTLLDVPSDNGATLR